MGALQNQLLQQGLTANDLATVLTAQANVNSNNLGLGNADLGSNVLGNSGLSNNVLGNNSLSSGPMSGWLALNFLMISNFLKWFS